MRHLIPLFASFLIILIAEFGDKTQLLTLSLAAKYPIEKVLGGVISATAVLMFIAVFAGEIIQKFIPMIFISILAGAFFIIYGLIIIAPVAEEKKEAGETATGPKDPFQIVFASFFLAEIGDKTQLATFALTAKYGSPLMIWLGASLGMIVANLFGIAIGNVLRNYLPEKIINFLTGVIFIVLGAFVFLSMLLRV